MTGDLESFSPMERRALYDVHARPVVTLHVEVATDESVRPAASREIARDGERLEKDLGHDDRATEVEDDAAIVQSGDRVRQSPEIAVTRVADRRSIRRRLLMNDLGTEGSVHGRGCA